MNPVHWSTSKTGVTEMDDFSCSSLLDMAITFSDKVRCKLLTDGASHFISKPNDGLYCCQLLDK